ncbi:MAG: thioesterase [Clostridiales bacterium]|nr:thioesterase [Clostridiales bacterium]
MNYLQDCALFHSESLNIGPDYLREHRRGWFVSSWQVVIDRYPKMFEKIKIETVPYKFSGCFGRRNVTVADESGSYIVRSNSIWTHINTDTGRPVRPDSAEVEAYGVGEPVKMDYAPRRIDLPENLKIAEPIPVLRHHIDTNHHVNNAQYVEIARGLFDEAQPVRELRVEYKSSAQLGDILYPKTGVCDGWNFVVLTDKSGGVYSTIAFRV